MTEEDWLACDDVTQMLIFLRGDVEPAKEEPDPRPRSIGAHGHLVWGDGAWVSARQLGCFAQEVCKKWWELPLDEVSRRLVLSYERFLAGAGSWDEYEAAYLQLWEVGKSGVQPLISGISGWDLNPYGVGCLTQTLAWVTSCYRNRERIEEVERTASEDDLFAWGFFGYEFPEFMATAREVWRPLPALLREIVGNPFRQITVDSAWRTQTATQLAAAINQDQALDWLPILADALEEAGCTDAAILDHLRGLGPHVRGCWALDLVLGLS